MDQTTKTNNTTTTINASGGDSIWVSLFGALPGTISGAAQVITAIKGTNGNTYYSPAGNGNGNGGTTTSNPNTIWYVLGGVAVLIMLFFMFKK